MPLSDLFETLLQGPLMLLYGGVFHALVAKLHGVGFAIVGFSVALNAVVLPLYLQMERAGRATAAKRAAMDREIARMKAHFSGRELYFYVTTVHRHFGYRPISVVFGSFDLYLQIFMFITVYRFLSGLGETAGVGFLGIPDLSRPDGILAGWNLLPFLMTAANIASALAYSADRKRRTSAVLLAGLFLVLLYDSPAALLLYWTTNNLLSLARNLVSGRLATLGPTLGARLTAALERP